MSELNAWFNGLPPERQAVLREDKWMLANAAFEAGQARHSALLAQIEEQKSEIKQLETMVPTVDDLDNLRKALCNTGISAPESTEELGRCWRSHVRSLIRASSNLDEMQRYTVQLFAEAIAKSDPNQNSAWLTTQVSDFFNARK